MGRLPRRGGLKPQHVFPLNDTAAHDTDGGPCPCMPRSVQDGGLVVHNAFDGREVGAVLRAVLDLLGKALSDHGHTWTEDEREAFEHAEAILVLHWPEEA